VRSTNHLGALYLLTYLLHGAESFLRKNAKPMKDKKRKRKYYERITMQAERTHTYRQTKERRYRVENEEAYALNESEK